MLHTLWSVKGGSGVTVCAAALAATMAAQSRATLLVDLCGDAPAALGLAEPDGPGVLDWLASDSSPAESLDRLRIPVTDGLALLPTGAGSTSGAGRADSLVSALMRSDCEVVVDAGVRAGSDGSVGDRGRVELLLALAAAGRSLMVIRPCYLALRRATRMRPSCDGVILLDEAGRSLGRRDVAEVLGLPVLTRVEVDPGVARSVDAGLLVRRPQRSLQRALRSVS